MIREGHAYVDEGGGKPVGDVFLRGSWRMEGRSVEGTQKNAGTASENDTAFKRRDLVLFPPLLGAFPHRRGPHPVSSTQKVSNSSSSFFPGFPVIYART